MKKNALNITNQLLNRNEITHKMRLRSIASSTAIETGESIDVIEAKLQRLRLSPRRVSLA